MSTQALSVFPPMTSTRRLPRPHSGDGPQHILITLLGDYWFGRDELLPSAALVELLAEFGANENAARQAMRRLTQRGLLTQAKEGRSTHYGIPSDIVSAQRQRLAGAVTFGADFVHWDAKWTFVTFSIPEKERDARRLLRNGLRTMGFGALHDGVWINPHDRAAGAHELLDDLGIGQGHVMRADWQFRSGDLKAVAQAFEIDSLGEQYRDFIEEYEPRVEWARKTVDSKEALRVRTKLTNDWLAFRISDPELPHSLLPSDWPRRRARGLFLKLYDLLGPQAANRFRSIIESYDHHLASIVTFHSSPLTAQTISEVDRPRNQR